MKNQRRTSPLMRKLQQWIPALAWLRTYRLDFLRADVLASITLAAYMIPAAIGDASLAGLQPEAGLYACLFGGLFFWLFSASRHTAITVTSAISLLVGASLGPMAGGDPVRFAALASLTALLVAIMALIGWLVNAGTIVNFVSESVLDGWKTGVALYLGSTQLPKLFGFSGSHGDFWERSGYFFSHLSQTNHYALAFGVVALAALILGKKFLKHKPVALFVVIGGIIAATFLSAESHGVKILGSVPQGLPYLGMTPFTREDINELLPLAFACFLLGTVESAAIGRMFASKHQYRFEANQELLALAGANLGAALGQGYPISGGMSQSLVNESGGAKTPLSGFFAALLLMIVVLFLSPLLANLPQCVLAAIVLVAVGGLFKAKQLKHLWHASRPEFFVAVAAALGVLGSGMLRGVMIGAVLSLVLMIRKASLPHVALLGRIPGTNRFSDLERHTDNESIDQVMIFRPEASLIYFNIDHVCTSIRHRVTDSGDAVRLVIIDLSAAPIVDVQGARELADLAHQLSTKGKTVRVVEALASVRDRLRLEGVDAQLGGVSRFTTIAEAIAEFQAANKA
jgi:high affinity sulfate transporter 1